MGLKLIIYHSNCKYFESNQSNVSIVQNLPSFMKAWIHHQNLWLFILTCGFCHTFQCCDIINLIFIYMFVFYFISLFQGKRIFFVTNNSSKSRAQYMKKFEKFGIEGYKVSSMFNEFFSRNSVLTARFKKIQTFS